MIFGLVITKKDFAVKVPDGEKIRCPKCAWKPAKSDQWLCEPGCGRVWNTFETYGVCPSCGKQWTETVCLRCHQWSAHDDWYAKDDPK